jgi:hypothetical protein
LSDPNTGSELSLLEALTELADPTKLKRFEQLAAQFRHGHNLLLLLSRPGGASEHLWGRQFELRDRGKDATKLCCETQDLFDSLVADFLAAGAAGRFSARGFIGADERPVPPRMFGDSRLRLRLDENAIDLPDGTRLSVASIDIRGSHDAEPASANVVAASPAATARRKRGPAPGTLDRYGPADRALYGDLERIVREDRVSITEAATRLADAGIAGIGTPASRAKRLAERYRSERKNQP